MNKINNYAELVAERKRVEYEILKQKNILKGDVQEVREKLHEFKEKLEPFHKIASFLGIFKKKEKPAVEFLKLGSSLGIDLLVRDKLLRNKGWMAKFFTSSILKGVSSLVIGNKVKHNAAS